MMHLALQAVFWSSQHTLKIFCIKVTSAVFGLVWEKLSQSMELFFFFFNLMVAKEMLVPYTEGDHLFLNSAFNCRHQIVIGIKALGTARPPWDSPAATFRSPPMWFLFPQVKPLSQAGLSPGQLWEALLPAG